MTKYRNYKKPKGNNQLYIDRIQLNTDKELCVLGIESSCDETAASVVVGREVKSNIISSQIDIHKKFGGVVPEVASRNHTLAIINVIDEALKTANVTIEDIDLIAVTYGAGLVGSLLVGVTAAKSLAYANNIPLIAVNHIEAHICANYAEFKELQPPYLSLVASGGHTSIIEVEGYNEYKLIGSTADDAIGEAFDKVARLLGLPYPGGPNIDRLAKLGQPNINFFKTQRQVQSDYSLSYSGLKTAVLNYLHNKRQKGEEIPVEDVCASFTVAAVDILVDTAFKAAQNLGYKTLVMAGGVASNSYLRQRMSFKASELGCKLYCPQPILCTDNAVMVAMRGYLEAKHRGNLADMSLNAVSNLRVKSH